MQCLLDLPIVTHPATHLINLLILESNLLKPVNLPPYQKLLNIPLQRPLLNSPDPPQMLLPNSLDPPQMPLPPFPRNPVLGQQEGTPFEEALNIAVALMLITEELCRRDRSAPTPKLAKAKEPDTFDSSDHKKLNNFILLCNLYSALIRLMKMTPLK